MNKKQLHEELVRVTALSPCEKRKVGAIITVDRVVDGNVDYQILASGYNHNPFGTTCECENGKTLPEVVHAEVACLNDFKLADLSLFSAYARSSLMMHTTHEPCTSCLASLKDADIKYTVLRKTPGEPVKLTETLAERGSVYGTFAGNAKCTQAIMRVLIQTAADAGKVLDDNELEAMHMIAHKLSRVANGRKTKKDNWHDIAGYAKLAEDLTTDQ